jgi:hypothetical protein
MTELKRCASCKSWEPVGQDTYGRLEGSGVCHAARPIWDVCGDPSDADDSRRLLPEHSGLLCVVQDGSQYSAQLITMPDFGCVMYKQKEPQND